MAITYTEKAKNLDAMTRKEKEDLVRRQRDIIRKRVNRLDAEIEKGGAYPNIFNAVEDNRRKYDMFDPETHKMKSLDVSKLSEKDLDNMIRQGSDFINAKTSTVSGNKRVEKERISKTKKAIASLISDSSVNDAEDGEYRDFWDIIKSLKKNPIIAEKLRNPDKYQEVFEEVWRRMGSGKSMKSIIRTMKSNATKEAKRIEKEAREEAEKLSKLAGDEIPSLRGEREGRM